MSPPALVEVDALTVLAREAAVVDGVSFSAAPGEVVALVGESGSGKSVTALAMMGLLDRGLRVASGSIRLGGRELLRLPEDRMRRIRGREMAMVFQEPMSSLNPVYPIGFQIAEVLRQHFGAPRAAARERAVELLTLVGIPRAAERAGSYPHELSGGMRQRVMLAIAMACEPGLLIADEPTTALDVTIQAQILRLIRDLRSRFGTAVLLITHDMGVVAAMADRVLVMYAGQIVEHGGTRDVFESPRHPYTRRLLACAPSAWTRAEMLPAIEGSAPRPGAFPSGCRFHPRCPEVFEPCAEEMPLLEDGVRCLLAREGR